MDTRGKVSVAWWALCAGAVVLYAFFAAIGGFSPVEMAGVSVGVGALAVLFAAHELGVVHDLRDGTHPGLMRAVNRMRERRGF